MLSSISFDFPQGFGASQQFPPLTASTKKELRAKYSEDLRTYYSKNPKLPVITG